MRHLFSVLIALVGSALAIVSLWFAAGWLARLTSLVFTPGGDAIPGYAALAVGALLLAASIAGAVALSSWGAVVVGALHVLGGLVALVWPFDPIRGVESPVWTVVIWFGSVWRETGDGAIYFIATGVGLAFGAVLLAGGLVSLNRPSSHAPAPAAARATAIAAGIPVLLAGLGMTVVLGGQLFRELFLYFRPDALTVALVLLAAALAAAGSLSARWSAIPLAVAGGITTVAGIVMVAAPTMLVLPGSPAGMDLLRTGATGLVLGLGVGILGLGAGLLLRARAGTAPAPSPGASPMPAASPDPAIR